MKIIISLNGFEVRLQTPDTLTHLDRNWVETIEDCIAQARRGPQEMDAALASVAGRFGEWDGYDKWAEANPDKVIPKEDEIPKPVPTREDVELIINKYVDASATEVYHATDGIMALFEDFLK